MSATRSEVTLDLTREEHRQEALAAVKRGDPVNTVRCGDCRHFERIDRPHIGRCAAGNGRYWLWDTDQRQCKDFEAAVEGRP